MSQASSSTPRDEEPEKAPTRKIYQYTPQPMVPDLKAHVQQLLAKEKDLEQRKNMEAFIRAIESGDKIGPDELFCKGKKIKSADWNVGMGRWFSFPTDLRMSPNTIYQQVYGSISSHRILFDVTLSPIINHAATGPVIRISVLYDTGSDSLTLYMRDLGDLDPNQAYANAMGPFVPFQTANGVVWRPTALGSIRLLDPTANNYIGPWFPEQMVIVNDNAIVDAYGQPVHDGAGNLVYEDNRLSGAQFRGHFFKGSGVVDGRLVLSTTKNGLVTNIPAN